MRSSTNLSNRFHIKRLSRAALAVSFVSGFAPAAFGSLPIFGGLSYDSNSNSGYIDAYGTYRAQHGITNAGLATGSVVVAGPGGIEVGSRVQTWTPTTYGTIPGITVPSENSSEMTAAAMNSSGTIVGNYTTLHPENPNSFGNRAFRYSGGTIQKLGDLSTSPDGRWYTYVNAINTPGISVGSSPKMVGTTNAGQRAVLWKATGTIANELQTLPPNANGVAYAEALDISDNGVIVGDSHLFFANYDLGTRPVRWTQAGAITQLGVFNTNSQSYNDAKAIAVNKAGVIVATMIKYNADDTGRPVVARYAPNSTTPEQLMGLGGGSANFVDEEISGITDGGMILGSANQYFGNNDLGPRPVYWPTSGSTAAVELPNLGLTSDFYTSGIAESANASGVIAGRVEKNVNGVDLRDSAVIWTTAGGPAKIIDLNTFLPANSPWTLVDARSISDTGFVSGTAKYASNFGGNGQPYQRAFSMLIPQAGTYGLGDANFDTKVNFDDLVILAQHYNQANAGQSINAGDFNLDGVVNFADLVSLAQNYGLNDGGISLGTDDGFAANWALAQSLVPEPTALAAIGVMLCSLKRVRRRDVC